MGEKLRAPGEFIPHHNPGRFNHLGNREDTESIQPSSLVDKLASIYTQKENRHPSARPSTPSKEELERVLHHRNT